MCRDCRGSEDRRWLLVKHSRRLMRSALVFGTFLVSAIFVSATEPEPYLKAASMPFYPPVCRIARIQGEVTVRFMVDERGDTSNIKADGPSLLKEAASQEISSWKYGWNSPCYCRVRRTVVVKYILGDGLDQKGSDTLVRWFGKSPVLRVEVEVGPTVIQTNTSQERSH
jgi:hypothetical protein